MGIRSIYKRLLLLLLFNIYSFFLLRKRSKVYINFDFERFLSNLKIEKLKFPKEAISDYNLNLLKSSLEFIDLTYDDFVELIHFNIKNKVPSNENEKKTQLGIFHLLASEKNSRGMSSLSIDFTDIFSSSNVKLVEYFVKKYEININDKVCGVSNLFALILILDNKNVNINAVLDMMKFLILKGADINELDETGRSIYDTIDNSVSSLEIRSQVSAFLKYENGIFKLTLRK